MIELGSGLAIDTVTAEMVVVDRARLDEEFGTSLDPCDRAVVAMVTGKPEVARSVLLTAAASLRRDALSAEVARLEGDAEGAVALLKTVLHHYQPQGLRLAVVLQHLGKAEHAAGRQEDAVAHLSEA